MITDFTFVLYLLRVLLALDIVSTVNAELYFTSPLKGKTCRGGESCTLSWLDDGSTPLLSTIGVCSVGLYTGKMQLVQRIGSVDVSSSSALEFTPLPNAGPDSDSYYVSFTSLAIPVSENGTQYHGYTAFFTLEGMSGSFSSPVASATASTPVPSSLATRTRTPTQTASGSASNTKDDDDPISTITVGKLSTSLPPLTTLAATTPISSSTPSSSASTAATTTSSSSSSRLITSSSSRPSTSTAPSPSSAPSNNAAVGTLARPIFAVVIAACFSLLT